MALQPAWDDIRECQPEVLLLLGDTIYLDRNDHDNPRMLAEALRSLYERQFAQPQFAALLDDLHGRKGRLIASYDDHDFLGDNRCGGDVELLLREAARQEFIRVFRPTRNGPEVYSLHQLGCVDLLLLDVRFHRRAAPSMDRDAVLGHEQWRWLESAVTNSVATYLLVASSTTLHCFGNESWEQHPTAFQRLRALLALRPGALVVSGDLHRNAVYDDSGVIEIVSSGVARIGAVFKAERRNWGLLHFAAREPAGDTAWFEGPGPPGLRGVLRHMVLAMMSGVCVHLAAASQCSERLRVGRPERRRARTRHDTSRHDTTGRWPLSEV